MNTIYKRKPKSFAEEGEDDSGWDEQDAELANGMPLESLGPENHLVGDRQWWKSQEDRVPNSPLLPEGEPESYARVDEPEPPAAKGISSKGAPISDAEMDGDTTPNASTMQSHDQQPLSTWERYREAQSHMPVMGKAPWYLNLAGRVASGLAGYSNAAGRTRNPIDTGALRENIEHPGFAEKQRVFESGMAPIRAELAAEMGQQEQYLKHMDTAAQAQLRQAQARQAAGRGHWYEAQAGEKWQVDPRAGVIYNRDSGAMLPLPVTKDPTETYQKVLALTGDKNAAMAAAGWGKGAPPPRQMTPMDQARDILLHPDQHSPADVQRAQALVHPPKQFAPQRGGGAGPRPPGAATFSAIEGQRTAAYTAAQARFERAMTAAGNNPQARAQAQNNLATEKRLADEGYARRVAAATGGGNASPTGGQPANRPPANRPPLSHFFGGR